VPSNFKNIGTAATPVYADSSSSLDACKTKCSTYPDCLAIDYVAGSSNGTAGDGDCYYYINTNTPKNPSECPGTINEKEQCYIRS